MVRFENVGLRYGLGPEVLRDLTFHIGPNSFQFLTGPSGAGKTSLLRLLFLSLKPTRGLITRMADVSGNLTLPRIIPVRPGGVASGSDWMGIRMTEASVLRGVDRLPLFAGFLGLAILLVAVAATWYREGR